MNKKVDAKFFRVVKLMLKDGATIKECAEYFNCGEATISRIKASENLEEYWNIMAAMYAKKKAAKEAKVTAVEPVAPVKDPEPVKQIVEHRQSVTVQATHFMEQNQRKQIEVLELISRKLTELLDVMGKLNAKWD